MRRPPLTQQTRGKKRICVKLLPQLRGVRKKNPKKRGETWWKKKKKGFVLIAVNLSKSQEGGIGGITGEKGKESSPPTRAPPARKNPQEMSKGDPGPVEERRRNHSGVMVR